MDIISLATDLSLPVLFMLIGIVLLVKGGDWTVNSSVFVARHFGLPPLIVGFTILAFGTSLPELIVSILAVIRGSAGIAMGNVIGSNIANILLVIGTAAFFINFKIKLSTTLIRDNIMMIFCSVLLLAFMFFGGVPRLAGAIMIALLIIYIAIQYYMATKDEALSKELEDEINEIEEHEAEASSKQFMPYLLLILGLASVAGGAEFLVRGAKESALIIGVPEAVIALSIIACGTSLPELSTSIIAAKKGHTDMVIGNIIGSNVFNILMIIGATALVRPILATNYAPQLFDFDIWVMLGISVLFAALIFALKGINKLTAGIFIAGYLLYNIYIYAMYIGA